VSIFKSFERFAGCIDEAGGAAGGGAAGGGAAGGGATGGGAAGGGWRC